MLKIFIYKVNNKKINNQLRILSSEEKKKAKAFQILESRYLYIAGKYLTRKIIGLQFKTKARDLVFKSNKYGRPALAFPKIKNFDFSLSHSGNMIALAISDSEVGIDIEQIKPVSLKIANSYFHKQETKFLHSQRGKELKNFYKIWTLKESFIKAIGKGLNLPLKNFYFEIDGDKVEICPKLKWGKWHFESYNISSGYKMAICSKNIIKPKSSILNFN